jgi:CelD/BcsL family acetyltransferase involved in cellulose biosynthesis
VKTDLLSIRTVTTLEEFETLAPRWNALLAQADGDNIFLTWEWLYTWAKHYLGEDRLWIVLVYKDADQLVGIAPLYVRKTKAYGVTTLRDLQFLGTGEVCSQYLDFIIARRYKSAVVSRIYHHLRDEVPEIWDTVTLAEVPAGSSTIDLWDRHIQEDGKVIDVVGTTACPIIHLPVGREDLTERMSGKSRYNLHRNRKRLEQVGRVAYERASSVHDVQEAFQTFVDLHQSRWMKDGLPGKFSSPRFLAFHQETTKIFGGLGQLRLEILRFNREAVAGVYGYSYKGRYSFYLTAFAKAVLPSYSTGTLLLLHCAEAAAREGHREFDLLRGPANYKMIWANELNRCVTLRHYNHHARAAAVKLLASTKDIVKVLVR